MWLDLSLPSQGVMLVFFFVLLPLLRWVWPIDSAWEIDEFGIPQGIKNLLYWVPNLLALIWLVSALALPFIVKLEQQSVIHTLGVWVSIWLGASLTLPACHELVHRNGFSGNLGRLLGACLGLISFTEEHRVHHAKSGRGQDPDCADRLESVYAFAWRSGVEALLAGWDYEIARQVRQGRSWRTNRIFWTGMIAISFCGLWFFAQRLPGFFFYLSIALATNFSFRAITFIQHWGLRQVPSMTDGRGVSWVSTCAYQSWVTLNISLHEQHHKQPTRTYWKLCSLPTELKLPVTYSFAFLLSLIPPVFRRMMSPRLDLWLVGASQGSPIKLVEGCGYPISRVFVAVQERPDPSKNC